MKGTCQNFSEWLKKRDSFTSIVVVGAGVVLTASAVTALVLILVEGGSIPSIPSGWTFVITAAMAVGLTFLHHAVNRFDETGELSYNGLKEHLQEKAKEKSTKYGFNAELAQKATTATVAESLSLGVLAATIVSSFNFDLLTSLALMGAIPAIVHVTLGQKMTQFNYWALENIEPCMAMGKAAI